MIYTAILWFGGVFGLWYIVGRSKITEGFRNRVLAWHRTKILACEFGHQFQDPKLKAEDQCPICFNNQIAGIWLKSLETKGPLQWLVLLAECPACFSTWVAIGAVLFSHTPYHLVHALGFPRVFGQVLFICLTTASSWALGSIIDLINAIEERQRGSL